MPDVAVIFRVVPSLYVPVAVSCAVPPAAVRDEVEGVMGDAAQGRIDKPITSSTEYE